MHHNHILKSLPLLASILGRKYGVQVNIGGDSAYTNGNVIQLPALPLDGDVTLLGLARGYIDHESAHIRSTDFEALKAANLTPLEKHIWNIIEDWRVENALSAIYPGCRENFQWLIKHLFLSQAAKRRRKTPPAEAAALILDWLLITMRSWDVPELLKERDTLRASAEIHYPGLTHELEPVFRLIPKNCSNTLEAFGFACEITDVIRRYARFMEQQNQKAPTGQKENDSSTTPAGQDSHQADPAKALQSLEQMLATDTGNGVFPADMGGALKEALKIAAGKQSQQGGQLRVAVESGRLTQPLSAQAITDSRQATTALRTRLQALMQAVRTVRNHSGYAGALNTRKLHTLAVGNAKVFLRRGERVGVNTAVHILLDASGSMNGAAMTLASQACFALASALHGIKGVSVGVTAFPGEKVPDTPEHRGHWNTVTPLLRHHEKLHTTFATSAHGGTPMDAALWWALQQMTPLPEPRKIVLLITDGSPDSTDLALKAIDAVVSFGIEVYGIGITDASIRNLLPPKDCRVINGINELAPSMFEILQKTLLNGAVTQ